MRIVVPLTYTVRYVPRRGTGVRSAPFLELMEWDVPEISMADTSDGIWIRTPIVRANGTIAWAAQQWRIFEGELIREAGRRPGGVSHIHADHLPHYENGRIRSNFIFQFLNEVLHLRNSHEHYNLAHRTMVDMATPGARLDVALPPAREVVGDDRESNLAVVERILGRLVLVDSVLWKRTLEPLLKVSNSYLQLDCTIDYNDDDEKRSVVEPLRPGEFTIPLVDWQRVATIEQRKGLPSHVHGVVDSVSPESPVTRDTDLWLAKRAAEFLLESTAGLLGERMAEEVRLWIDLRDLVAEGDGAALRDLLDGIESLRSAMSDRWELFAERLHDLLDPIEPGMAKAPQLPFLQARPRR
ncbi:hypothetical protein [Rhizobium sp. BK176]|uniref:hypothetical protein n=1 Tax=Rhizobium sp. BK176 TaxID=2587071 RepID=UPI00216A12A1|nr:hypothetical protein [Rhizobium sp. BK176]MCS4089578.1 hypothetical protein [Rhizobium sp. BK176]